MMSEIGGYGFVIMPGVNDLGPNSYQSPRLNRLARRAEKARARSSLHLCFGLGE
jgi:hypothetical protein